MLPYDGSPGGNALGMQFDEERRRFHDETINVALAAESGPSTTLEKIASLLGLAVFLAVILYGTVG